MTEIEALEYEIFEKAQRLAALRRAETAPKISDYSFDTLNGPVLLSSLFGAQDRLLMIHNMGQACRYCTLWADGLNGILPHLEDAMAVVLTSKDSPEIQRQLAMDRGWQFRTVSHRGGAYMQEQCAMDTSSNIPGAAVYERDGDKILRRGKTYFGPGDLYSPMWHILALAGLSSDAWTPQFHYWQRPAKLEDGGANVNDIKD